MAMLTLHGPLTNGSRERSSKNLVSSFTFVVASQDSLPNEQVEKQRKAIRSHNTLLQRKKERHAAIERLQTRKSLPVCSNPDTDSKDIASSGRLAQGDPFALSPKTLSQEKMDPFNVSRTLMTTKMQFYFQFFDNTLFSPKGQKSRLQSIFQNAWGSVTTIDPAVLYTFIAIGAAQIGIKCWGSLIAAPEQVPLSEHHVTPWDTLMYRTKAVQNISERLSTSAGPASDSLIAAVSIVMMTETLMGQVEYMTAHSRGLKQMVMERGGIHALPPPLIRRVMIGEVKSSSTTLSCPAFEFQSPPLTKPDDTTDVQYYNDTSHVVDQLLAILHPDLQQVFLDLLRLTRFGWTKNFDAMSVRKCIYMDVAGLQCLSIEGRLLYFQKHPCFTGIDSIAGCCIIAGLLYINTALWPNYLPASAILRNLCVRLERALDATTSGPSHAFPPKLLLWVLFIGCFASEGEGTSITFVSSFRKIAGVLNLGTAQEVTTALKDFLYVPEIYDDALVRIWENGVNHEQLIPRAASGQRRTG